jgi:hypothetical protein
MSLSRAIAAALDARPESGALPIAVAVEEGPHRLTLQLTASSPLGVECDALEFQADDHPEWSLDDLKGWGDRLAGRLTYLMEPLVILEADPIAGEVALRSRTPTPRQGQRSYYEVRLGRAGTLRLGRVAYDEAARVRRPVPCQLTREALERLVDDLVASVVA